MGRTTRGCSIVLAVLLAVIGLTTSSSAGPPTRPNQGKLHPDLIRLARASVVDARAEAKRDIIIDHGSVAVSAVAIKGRRALARGLRKLGLTDADGTYSMVGGYLPISSIRRAARLKSLRYMRPDWVETSNVADQGDVAQRSDVARATFPGIDGTGVKVGVLSDTYNCLGGASTDVANGDLPSGGVTVLEEGPCSPGTDEGRAMLQIVHDVAPGAAETFATAFPSRAHFATNITALANAGAKVIVDDVFYPGDPWFQDGVIAQAIDHATAQGVSYFTIAGNFARRSYESPFRDSHVQGVLGGTAHDFDPGPGVVTRQQITIPANSSLFFTLQWADSDKLVSPLGPKSDFDVHFFQSDDTTEIGTGATTDNIHTSLEPLEIYNIFTGNSPATIFMEIDHMAGPVPKLIKWLGTPSSFTIDSFATNSPTAFGHSNAKTAITVGAAFYEQTPVFGTDPALLEPFSSAGGIKIYIGANGKPLRKPQIRRTPDFVAPDGADTSFFGSSDPDSTGHPNFFGTSAAAPHAAGAAALGLQKVPGAKWFDFCNAFSSTAHDMGVPGYDRDTGSGLIDVADALAVLKANSYGPCRKKPRR